MPFNVLVQKLNELSNLITSFVKESQGMNTVKHVKERFKPAILKLHLRCIFANLGLCMDLCKKIRDEKSTATGFSSNWRCYDFDCDIVLE